MPRHVAGSRRFRLSPVAAASGWPEWQGSPQKEILGNAAYTKHTCTGKKGRREENVE